MRRHELTEEQFEQIKDLLPSGEGEQGRPWEDHHRLLNGMFWILNTGAPWRDLPERYGPWQTVYSRFRRWQADGTFDRILERLQMKLDEEGRIDWELFCIDGTTVQATRAAGGAPKSEAKKGTLTSLKITPLDTPEADSPPKST